MPCIVTNCVCCILRYRFNDDFQNLLCAGMHQMANVYQVHPPSPRRTVGAPPAAEGFLMLLLFLSSHLLLDYLWVDVYGWQGSFLEYDWSDGDVVFANSTCFDDQLMAEMGDVSVPPTPPLCGVCYTFGAWHSTLCFD